MPRRQRIQPQRHIRAAVLGVDFGSTSLRAGLICPDDPHSRFYPVRNPTPDPNRPFSPGDFSTACTPFTDKPLEKLGNAATGEPGHVLAKYLMYLLANAQDHVMARYPLSKELRNKRGDQAFLTTCRAILVQLIKNLKQSVDAVCAAEHLEYTEIVFTLPVQWEKPFQTAYLDIIEEAFDWGEKMDHVHFIAEADALAHYVITTRAEVIEDEDWDRILFLDFGGHSMSFSLYRIEQFEDDKPLCLIEQRSGGIAGGNEMWFHHIAELISHKLRERGISDPKEELRWKLTMHFVHQKSQGKVNDSGVTHVYTTGGSTAEKLLVNVSLQSHEIEACYRRALDGPVNLAKEQLQFLATFAHNSSIGVLVAGGSLTTEEARSIVFSDSPVPMDKVKFNHSLVAEYLSTHICHGAALAIRNKTTVREFFDIGGAAIGIQARPERDDPRWEDFAYLAYKKSGTFIRKDFTKAGMVMEMRLVCDPHYSRRKPLPGDEELDKWELLRPKMEYNNCYDLWHLGFLKAGTHTFEVTLGDDNVLLVKMSRVQGRMMQAEVTELKLPLYFDPGHNCVHVDVDSMPGSDDIYQEQQQHVAEANPELVDEVPTFVRSKTPLPYSLLVKPGPIRKRSTSSVVGRDDEGGGLSTPRRDSKPQGSGGTPIRSSSRPRRPLGKLEANVLGFDDDALGLDSTGSNESGEKMNNSKLGLYSPNNWGSSPSRGLRNADALATGSRKRQASRSEGSRRPSGPQTPKKS
ncbi:hypothetical protein B0H63DRAFT_526473 [Podospora didyma]|uniref:Uncharacterized protein n=1 Tax=Podospora didyma TaxID=330526 RepID=A0AAE0KG30_9PEZI|nr:hypothetical protein B0H63DRAFT_526473 [Podospora didyma]